MRTQHRSAGHGASLGRESWTAPNSGTSRCIPNPGSRKSISKPFPPARSSRFCAIRSAPWPSEGPIESVGAGFPGVIRGGVILESPNLGQLKGLARRRRTARRAEGRRHRCPGGAPSTMPTRWPPASPPPTRPWMTWCASGTSATASATAAIRTTTASGRRATWWSRSTPRSATAAAAASATWKASWGTAPCACGSWIWSRRRSSSPPAREISAPASS